MTFAKDERKDGEKMSFLSGLTLLPTTRRDRPYMQNTSSVSKCGARTCTHGARVSLARRGKVCIECEETALEVERCILCLLLHGEEKGKEKGKQRIGNESVRREEQDVTVYDIN